MKAVALNSNWHTPIASLVKWSFAAVWWYELTNAPAYSVANMLPECNNCNFEYLIT